MSETILKRSEVAEELKWDMSLIYSDINAMEEDLTAYQKIAKDIKEKYEGNLNTAENITKCIEEKAKMDEIAQKLENYSDLPTSADFTDENAANLRHRVFSIINKASSDLAFIEGEILANDASIIEEAIQIAPKQKYYLKELLRIKPHRLSIEMEQMLSTLYPAFHLPMDIYQSAKYVDMKFDSFTIGDKEYPMSYTLYEDEYEYHEDTAIRRKAFEVFYNKLRQYQATNAASFNGFCQNQKQLATIRGFKSMTDANLFNDGISQDLYNRQIDLITTKLAPYMRKYAKLLQHIHKLDKMTYADLKLTVDPAFSPKVSIEKAREYIKSGLSVMGEEYGKMIDEAFDNHWIDFAQNIGKSAGGFCSFIYGMNSYILLNWHGRMSDVFTLAHELGHAGHSRYLSKAQPIYNSQTAMYYSEAPSTTNEIFMARYMLKTNSDKRFRRWVLANMVSNTYYHNFVTHLLEAAFQREVYKLVDAGESVHAETLNGIYRKVLTDFWGDAVEIPEGSELTWMRQPHYYMGLYSYSYSAGLTIGTQVAKRLEQGDQSAVADWIKVMSAGSTMTVEEFAKNAGVDITTEQPLLDTIETIGGYIEEICQLTKELEEEKAI